jgi:predicted Zn finger-like uncharacterized protein
MIVTCTGCQARYRLDASRVPSRRIRVRCPDCESVFDLDGTRRPDVTPQDATPTSPPRPAPPRAADEGLVLEPASAAATVDPGIPETPADPTPQVAAKPRAPQAPEAAPSPQADTAVAVADPPRPARRRRRDKAEMLARALVSDILVYNRDARDQAVAEGNLLEVLGPEIKKSWELYKEKVGAEAASSTTYFKDALNEILADGQRVF